MVCKVFFSFHYDDVARANVVRNSDVIARQYERGARFYDKSLWEEAKKQGVPAIKRMINGALDGSSVTCVLIGQETWQRPWVRYEILKSVARGNGILGVQIHDVGFGSSGGLSSLAQALAPQPPQFSGGLFGLGAFPPSRPTGLLSATLLGGDTFASSAPTPGPNPFRSLGYTIDRSSGMVTFHEIGPDNQWRQFQNLDPVPLTSLSWLAAKKDADNLENQFPVYSWKLNSGYQQFPSWTEAAARKVGR
ncbi:hypothetical protein H261_21773 [Paramagnetospirillum caucaseum]|uniref:Thoeris protein ThsB TIR-like domain-containing protein n=1 Tax=Paramagnetospirillum caucaseum TaxID=1244869 RepID=M2Z0H4_9PROT|nr:TIR domain-containing protein [Paramagnetospirillum caucaseum]EME67780.1 hypothetical protein H261_21773 [Paramagnetospirillum caucaseum]